MSTRESLRCLLHGIPAAAILLAHANGTASHAAPIRYEYGGVITSADPSTDVATGTRFSGMFTYDPEHKPSGTSADDGFRAYYYGLSHVGVGSVPDGSGMTLQIGGRTVLANPGGVQVLVSEREYPGQAAYDSEVPGQHVFGDAHGPPAGPYTRYSVSTENLGDPPLVYLEMTNSTRSVFGSLAPPTALNLADFTQARLDVHELHYPGSKTLYTGTIDTLTVVPEPAYTTLLCAAAGWLALARRRRAGREAGGEARDGRPVGEGGHGVCLR